MPLNETTINREWWDESVVSRKSLISELRQLKLSDLGNLSICGRTVFKQYNRSNQTSPPHFITDSVSQLTSTPKLRKLVSLSIYLGLPNGRFPWYLFLLWKLRFSSILANYPANLNISDFNVCPIGRNSLSVVFAI